MRNIKMTIEYDGGRYQGWQRLGKDESANTISNKLIDVLQKMTGETVELNCGERTEVGVHAYGQVVNFKTSTTQSPAEIKQYLNRYLPMDIAVLDAQEMPDRFHATLNAKLKTYIYRIVLGDAPSVFDRKYTYYSFQKPDIALMQQAATALIGRHDFKCFSTAKKNKSTEKEIFDIDVYSDQGEIQITIRANDFLHNMARLIIGTLLDVGVGKRKIEDIELIFKGHSEVGAPCDAKGLYLAKIDY